MSGTPRVAREVLRSEILKYTNSRIGIGNICQLVADKLRYSRSLVYKYAAENNLNKKLIKAAGRRRVHSHEKILNDYLSGSFTSQVEIAVKHKCTPSVVTTVIANWRERMRDRRLD
jgi:hypothetical protein